MTSNRSYTGNNFWMLLCLPYTLPFYLTFEQARSLGYIIRKGEKATMMVFCKILESEDKNGEIKKIPFLRYYNVFSLTQTGGIDPEKIPDTVAFDHDFNSITAADQIIYEWKDCPKIKWDDDCSFHYRIL